MTTYDPDIHHRRSIRLKNYDYSEAGAYFVTLCIQNRECLLGDIIDAEFRPNDFGCIANDCWKWLAEQYAYIELDEWILMPNHFHGIIVIADEPEGGSRTAPTSNSPLTRKTLGRLIGAFKTVSTKRINQIRGMEGAIAWQRNYYEHIIRNDKELERIRAYIISNPSRWADDENNPMRVSTPR